jgi:tetratricopeptide (TPR) repeat protein
MARDRAADAARLRRALAVHPGDAAAWHNLAAAEGDLGNLAASEAAAARAIAQGLAAPETRLVLARAQLGQGKLDDAERAFEAALALRPGYPEAHLDLAQLRWMRTGDAAVSLEALEGALQGTPDPALYLVRSIALEYTGQAAAAAQAAEDGLARVPHDVQLLRQAAHLHAELGWGEKSVSLARQAAALMPADPGVQITLCEALLAAGANGEAEGLAARLAADQPLDQHAVALQATAWRLLHDRRYGSLHDYGAFVASRRIAAPPGWASLDAFLAALRADLEGLHPFQSHPFQQSVRGGSQLTLHAQAFERPLVKALFAAIEAVASPWLARLGAGSDPFRSRNTGRYSVTGAWSVRLATGGFHSDHVHPRGWLSGVFYVDIPPEVAQAGDASRAGWLRLGRPGIRTRPELPPDCYVKPESGVLVLFPAYVWHGVEPFASPRARLTLAFDALPA